ncbi:MAG: hypothetical protein AAGD43_35050 [Pseudomonadota bacterium]
MRAGFRSRIGCTFAAALVLLGTSDRSKAKKPERSTTIARVEAFMFRIEQQRERSAPSGLMPVGSWETSLENWRPRSRRRGKSVKIQRLRTAPQAIPQLVSYAICEQDAASLRVAHRLDALLAGQLFNRQEVMIANEITRRRQLDITFKARRLPIADQALKDINRSRRLERVLAERGPDAAIEFVSSFRLLCSAASTD